MFKFEHEMTMWLKIESFVQEDQKQKLPHISLIIPKEGAIVDYNTVFFFFCK